MRGIEDRWSARDRWLRPTIPNASAADCVIRRRRQYSHLLAAPIENPSAPREAGTSNPPHVDYTDRIRVRRCRFPE